MLFVYCRKKKQWQKSEKKNKKQKILPTYLSYFFGACNPQCRTQTYFHTVESLLVTNVWIKSFWLIIAGSYPLCKRDGDWSSVYSSKNGGGYIFLQKREKLLGKTVEEWRLLRENNLCLLANLCVYKSKKYYNPRYMI